jgi:hypothetical protein
MDGTGVDMNKNELKALRSLEADASRLERIENLLDRFNVFETVRFVARKVKH